MYTARAAVLKLLHKLLHTSFPVCPKTHQNDLKAPTIHNNIRKTGSFRNQQVIGSTRIVGSAITADFQDLSPRLFRIMHP